MKARDQVSSSSHKLMYSAHVESNFANRLMQSVGQSVTVQTTKNVQTGTLQHVSYDYIELQVENQVFCIRLMEIVWFTRNQGDY